MTLQQLIEAARKAIADGKLEEAQKLTAQAKALKEIESLAPAEESVEAKNMKAELDALKAKFAALEAEPPTNKAAHLTVTEDETEKKAKRPFKSLGEQLKAVASAYLYPHQMDERLKAQKAVLGANEGQGSDGGFLVQTDFAAEIFKEAHETGVIASRCRRTPVGPNANGLKFNAIDETSRATGSRFGGVRGYWLAEGGALTGTQPKFRQVELNLKKLGALMYATDELLADTTALGGIMQMGASEELAWMLDESIVNGTGAGQPLGILNAPVLVSIAKEAGQSAASLVFANIQKMWARMWAGSRANAAWFINQDVEPALNSLDFPVGTGGVPVYLPPGGLSASPYATLLGRPIIPTEFNQTLGTLGDIILADFSRYLLIDKGGTQMESSIHVQFLTDQTAFRWIYRVDGQPLWNAPLTPAKGSNTLSPFVSLATRG